MKLLPPNGQSLLINETSHNYAPFDNQFMRNGARAPCSVSPPCQLQPLPPNGPVRTIFGSLFPPHNQPPPMNGDFSTRRDGFYPPCGMYIQENNFRPPQYVPYSIQGPALPVQNMPQHYPVQGIHPMHQVQGMHNRPLQILHAHPVQGLQQISVPCRTQARFPLPHNMSTNNVVAITSKCLSSSKSTSRKNVSPKSMEMFSKVSSLSGKGVKSEEKGTKSENKTKKQEEKIKLEDKAKKSEERVNKAEDKVTKPEVLTIKSEKTGENDKNVEETSEEPVEIVHPVNPAELCIIADKYRQRLNDFPQLPIDVHDVLHFIDENIQINIYFDAEIQVLENESPLANTKVHLIVTQSPELSLAWILAFVKCIKGSSDCQDPTVLKYNSAINAFLTAREMNESSSSLYLKSADDKKDQNVVVTFRSHEETQRFLYVVQMFQNEMEVPKAKPYLNSDNNLAAHSESSESSEEDLNTSGYVSS